MVSKKLPIKLPRHALSNVELVEIVKKLKIPYFRGVFMRNQLPRKIRNYESGIINLDESSGNGTHWTGYVKHGKVIYYFDSIGNLSPPIEAKSYFKSDNRRNRILYNRQRYQKINTYNCGHLVLKFLYNWSHI
ncbi:hypothetical protein WA026_014249 [Henosepilachna vigintioctopunctata]|uniref:Ubiquitin-like protease family profile domain-containing protein n=1 Tax=Henosepilachna vigintioctopunctata TaxID=420089 RepID=A0AAW1TTU0_9CUCU